MLRTILEILTEALSPLIAVVAGAFVYRRMEPYMRLLFWQVGAWCLTLAAAYAITTWQRWHLQQPNNHLLFNVYMLAESLMLFGAATLVLQPRVFRWMAWLLFGFFILVYSASAVDNYREYFHIADTVNSLLLTIVFSVVAYQSLQTNRPWYREGAFYCSAGILIYFACSIPHISAFHYLQENFPGIHSALFHYLNDTAANIRYLSLALGFWTINLDSHE